MGTLKSIHLERENLQFSVFTSEDIKKLSVAKIITGLSFDILGRPLNGGLYDLSMGTSGKSSDPCATCLGFGNCPGHLGHIELQILLYNPFFQRIIYDIFRLSCLSCFKLQFTEHAQKVQLLQFELINAGYIIEAKDISIYKSEMVGLAKSAIKTESGNLLHPKLAEMEELLAKGPNTNITETKTSCDIRADVIRDILQSIPTTKKCMFCHEKLKKIKFLYKRLVMSLTKEDKEKLSEQNIEQTKGNKVILADECRHYLRQVYDNHSKLLNEIFPLLKTCSSNIESPVDVLFMDVVPVTPPKSRPINKLNDMIIEHPQTVIYKNILNSNSILKLIIENVKKNGEGLKDEAKNIFDNFKGSTSFEKVYFAWQELQNNVDTLLDSSIDKSLQGLKQILEKKDGLIRKHMMGKRVNYAARTVITPDPNISVDEVGIPDIFAKKLSYPVPVSPWNISLLRKMVMNGPDIHPGANYIEDEKGFKIMIPADNPSKRESYAKLLYSKSQNDGIKIVHRHLINGDVLLLNRQPTLHKPSIMAHKARILPGEKTFRLHYSNCKAYNADFDGDEMNAHFPQNELARSEAYNIVNVANQYLVPKDGTPLGGLIQDHVISGVKLSLRGRFFNSEDYQQLVYQGLSSLEQREIKCLRPTILKPFKLWSGKQVLSTIIMNIIPEGYPLVNLTSTAKVGTRHWKVAAEREWVCGGTPLSEIEMSESEVIIREGELLVGVLDKEQYGATKFGLIHCMYELYGGDCSTQLLTAFTRVFTYFLQKEGFTLGVQDILVTSHADHKRRKIIRQCRRKGNEIAATALNLDEVPEPDVLAEKLEEAYQKDPKFRVILDRNYKSVLDKYTNEINQTCLPGGLISKFPQNNLQLMVLSGAKGSMVNTMQISCLLGQIELEGKRPPLMISGKSLPSFATFETSPKSGGFIDGRFMTGIQPQDFFFHCMAGREGLIDTAVKTSRSGYLQRCLIKHLEGLSVAYDLTVRDSDNSIVQFLYGEDGLDVSKSKFFNPKALKFLDENRKVILHKKQLEEIKDDQSFIKICKILKKIKSWKKKNGDPNQKRRHSAFQKFSDEITKEIEIDKPNELKKNGRTNLSHKITKLWQKADEEKRKIYGKKYTKCPEPVVATYKPDNFYGAVSEYLEDLMENYMKKKKDRNDDVKDIVYLKAMQSLAQPGEPVGLLAAQSIGEPSTQMTLNTFHFAGRGEMNVTLGIPRLREILMLASANIKTPSMDIPFKENMVQRADKLRVKFNRVTLADVLEYVNVKLKLVVKPSRFYVYTLYFKFLPRDAYSDEFCVKPKQIIKYMSNIFFKLMFRAMSQSIKSKCTVIDIDENSSKEKNGDENKEPEDDDMDNTRADTNKDKIVDVADSSDDENGDADEDDTTGIKLKNRKHDEKEYDDPEVEEEVQDANENDDDVEVELNEQDVSTEDAENDLQNELLMNNDMVNEYKFDRENYLWCQLTFSLPMKYKNLDISSILKGLAHKSVVYQIPNIKRAITYKNNNDLVLKTEGINISEMFNYDKYLDLNRLYSNDIHSIAKVYGIEAANRVIVKEVQNVFKVYGIEVDLRHLLMIADYMTFDGTFKPLSRKGLENSASPLQQMSFESCLQFLKQAVFYGRKDDLLSPSSRLMVGLPVKSGTGLFSIHAETGTTLC